MQGGQKTGPQTHDHNSVKSLPIYSFFSLEDSWVNLQLNGNLPPHLACVATLPCETLMSAKQAINDKLQGSVTTYFRCGGVADNQIKKGLLLSVRVKNFF